jgi:hypothetical protein
VALRRLPGWPRIAHLSSCLTRTAARKPLTMFLVNDPYGNKIFEFRGGRIYDRTGKTLAVVVNTKKHANIMLGAAAYWEFVWSLT